MAVLIDYQLRNKSKWVALTFEQRTRLVELWMWIDEQDMDGYIPAHIPPHLHVKQKDLDALEAGGWLDPLPDGWYAHDWHDMNPPVDPDERERWFHRRRQAAYKKRNGKGDGKGDGGGDG